MKLKYKITGIIFVLGILIFGLLFANKLNSNQYLSSITSSVGCDLSDLKLTTFEGKKAFLYEGENYNFYYHTNLFENKRVAYKYICKSLKFNIYDFNFLKNYFGFVPEPFDIISTYDGDFGGYSSYIYGEHKIRNIFSEKITMEAANNLASGLAHEFVHAFLGSTRLNSIRYFEEGLADFVEHSSRYNTYTVGFSSGDNNYGLYCFENDWVSGYENGRGELVEYARVAYSDFSVEPNDILGFYHPSNTSSYYRSGECFWAYVAENYGHGTVRKIVQKWHSYEDDEDYARKFIIDVVPDTLKDELTDLVMNRYNYDDASYERIRF